MSKQFNVEQVIKEESEKEWPVLPTKNLDHYKEERQHFSDGMRRMFEIVLPEIDKAFEAGEKFTRNEFVYALLYGEHNYLPDKAAYLKQFTPSK